MGDPRVNQGHAHNRNNFYSGFSGIISKYLSMSIIFINRIRFEIYNSYY